MSDRPLLVWPGSIRAGRLFIGDRVGFDGALSSWPDGAVLVRLESVRDIRRPVLNAYYWVAVVPTVSDVTGYTEQEAHAELKAFHLSPRLQVARGGSVCWHCARVINGSTRGLSSREQSHYIDRIRMWLAHEYGAVVPDPARLVPEQGGGPVMGWLDRLDLQRLDVVQNTRRKLAPVGATVVESRKKAAAKQTAEQKRNATVWTRDRGVSRASGRPVVHASPVAAKRGEVAHLPTSTRSTNPGTKNDPNRCVLLTAEEHALSDARTAPGGKPLLEIKGTDGRKAITFIRRNERGRVLWRRTSTPDGFTDQQIKG